MSKIKVLAPLPNLSGGGAERIAFQVVQGLHPSRFDRTILVHERQGSFVGTDGNGATVLFANDGPYRRSQLLKSLLGTIRLARHADVVVGANEGRASFLALLASRLTGTPLVLWVHVNWAQFSRHVSWRQRAALGLYRHADAVVACSTGAAASFVELFPETARLVSTIHNGVPLDEIRRLAAEPLDPDHESIFADPVVIAVGRLDYQKAHELLVAAHAEISRKGIFHRLVILGDGSLRASLEEQARSLGVAETVHLLGFQKNPYRFMRRARVFAHSARFEGLPLVLAEALACGLPIVSADCPSGPREILDGGRYGVLVEPENSAALAAGLERILADDATRTRLAELAEERAPSFGMQTLVGKWESLLEQVARRGRSSG